MRRSSLAVLTLILAAVAALAQAGPKTDAAKEPATTTAPKPEVKTAEQQFRNIQFLKAVPADQLIPAMQYINAALGVECNFCHVGQPGRLEPDKDDKKEKQTARKMMAMTKAINDANFEGKSEVSCTTCHAGHAHPIALPPLFDEHNPNAHDANRHDLPHPELPTLEQVAQAYEKAIGGKEAIQKLTTRTLKATAVGFQGQKFQIEAWQKAPGMLVQSITFPNGQTRVQIFDGQSGWIKTDRGVNQISGPDLAGLRVVSRFDRDLAPLADLANARVTGIEKIDGHECYVVRGLHSDKDFSDRLYFDKQSGLLLRRTSAQRTILGQVSDNTDYSDYKDVQGVKVAFTIKRTTSENVLTRTLEKIEFNQPVDDSKFARPAAPGGGGK